MIFVTLFYLIRMIRISQWSVAFEAQFEKIASLFIELAPGTTRLTPTHLDRILSNPNFQLWVAVKDDSIVGSISFAYYHIPTGTRAWIEDVVVDKNFRGQKIGEMLVLHAIEEAKKLGITQIDLTSRPERIEANKLYQKLGFQQRQTNAYRLMIK